MTAMAMKRSLTVAALGAVFSAALMAGCYMVGAPGGLGVGITPFAAAPRMSYISGTQIQVVSAPGVAGDVFFYSGTYWRSYNNLWYRSSRWNGGWVGVGSVPRAFLGIPLGHPMHRAARHHPLYSAPVYVRGSTSTLTAPVVGRPARTPTVRERFAAPVRRAAGTSSRKPVKKAGKKKVYKSFSTK